MVTAGEGRGGPWLLQPLRQACVAMGGFVKGEGEIIIDGVYKTTVDGQYSLQIQPGIHNITFRKGDLEEYRNNITIVSGETITVNCRLGNFDFTRHEAEVSSEGIPISGDLSFPIYITPVSKVNSGETIEVNIGYTNEPLTITGRVPDSITNLVNYIDPQGYSSIIAGLINQYILDGLIDVKGNELTYPIGNPMGNSQNTIYSYPSSYPTFYLYMNLNGNTKGKVIVDGPAYSEQDWISFSDDRNIELHISDNATPGEKIKVGIIPFYDALVSLSAQVIVDVDYYIDSYHYESDIYQFLPPSSGWYTFEFPSDATIGFISLVNYPPIANFTFPSAIPTTLTDIEFSDSSYDPDGNIASWSWDFGDGSTASAQNPTHKYSSPGTYTVTLTVFDDTGGSNSTQSSILVEQKPIIITGYKNYDEVKGTITISGSAFPTGKLGNTVQSVEVKIDDRVWQQASGSSSWTYDLNTKSLKNGNHVIYVRCSDGINYSDIESLTLNVNNKKNGFGGIPGFEMMALIVALGAVILVKRRRK